MRFCPNGISMWSCTSSMLFFLKIVLSSLPITLLCTVKLGSTMSSTDLMVNDSHENVD